MEQTDKALDARPATFEELSHLIDTSDQWAAGALIRLYELQTLDEQNFYRTEHINGVGFNSFDAGILTDMSKYYIKKGYLTDPQLRFVRKTIKKYISQLVTVGLSPVEISNIALPVPEKKEFKKASLLLKRDSEIPSAIRVEFEFPKGDKSFIDILSKVKTLPDRQWRSEEKYWRVALSLEAGDKLKEWGFEFSEGMQKWYNDLKGMTATELDTIYVPGLNGTPYPYQLQGIHFIESRKGRALVADSMGLGKTLQALGYCQLHPEKRPVIIVCPASLKLNWERECRKWLERPGDIQIISGKKDNYFHGDIIIINYDILSSWQDKIIEYCKGKDSVLISDECHYLKNSQAIRTKAMKKLAKSFAHTIFLSGTPIVNRPAEFFNSINMIRPDLFPSYWRFMEEFTEKKYSPFSRSGYVFEGARNMDKLHKLLTETIMIRRRKEEVLTELPPKIRTIIPLEIDNRNDYEYAESDIVSWILDNEGREKAEKAKSAEVLVEFEKLKQLSVKGKMSSVIDWIEDFLNTDEKLIIFATHKLTLDLLQERFGKISVRLDGSTSIGDRQKAVDKFQNDDNIRLFLGNVKAAGVGITLTAASNVAFIELPWTPGDLVQAEDRAHRIGQKDTVTVWHLVAQNTVEEDIAAILSNKQKVLDAILDGKESDENSVLTELISKVVNRDN